MPPLAQDCLPGLTPPSSQGSPQPCRISAQQGLIVKHKSQAHLKLPHSPPSISRGPWACFLGSLRLVVLLEKIG